MATKKSNGGAASKGSMGWGSSSNSSVVQRPNAAPENESHIPWVLVICLMVMAMTLIVTFLFVGTVYVDLNNAVIRAKAEINHMRELRKEIIYERRANGQD